MIVQPQSEVYELTPTQQAMLIYSLYAPRSKAYFEQVCYAYKAALDVHAFAEAWQQVVSRHAILRTSFSWNDSEHLVQIVHPGVDLPFEEQDWRELFGLQQEERLKEFLRDDSERGFDLACPSLLRVAVLQTQDDAYWIVVSNHHIVLDGWSMSVVRNEVSQIYRKLAHDEPVELGPARHFGAYVEWLDQQQTSTEAETFWRHELEGFSLQNDLPIDKNAGKLSNPNETFSEKHVSLSPSLTASIQSCARRHHLTMSAFVQGAWAVLLSRYCGVDDVVFGITVSGRPYEMPGIESMVGLLINTLPVRVELDPQESCLSCLKKVQDRGAGLLEHEHSSLKQIQQWSDVPRNSPLFETLLVFENFAGAGSSFRLDGPIEVLGAHFARTNYPLTLVVDPGNHLRFQLVYHRSRFAEDAIERMLEHLSTILEAMAADMEKPLSSLPLLTEAATHTLLHEWNDNNQKAFTDEPVTSLFERQCKLTPEAVAVSREGTQLTYAQLNERANQLAHYLKQLGVGPETLVGVCVERSIDMVIAVLATLKARGAYVPLDPAYPKNRLAFMLNDSGIQVLLTRGRLSETLPDYNGAIVRFDDDAEVIQACSKENLGEAPQPADLAYVIYTSGSTGNPKGTMIEHHSLTNFTMAAVDAYEVSAADRILQFASLSFDTSVEEIFPALVAGATVVLRTDAMLSSAQDFLQKCGEFGITILDLPTAYWHELTDELAADGLSLPESLRLVILGGEKALPERLASWRQHAGTADRRVRLVNTYGPTETTIVATMFDLSPQDDNKQVTDVPIGRPVNNLTVYVLDRLLRPVPIGIPGELYIGGAGVARGYLHRPDLTAEKFVASPFGSEGGVRLYKTGDLVCYRPDSNLEFLGRIDNQVKIRGFRVELEEIEQAIRAHQDVSDAVVIAEETDAGDKRLLAYVVPARQAQPTISELRELLAEKLPAYMLPSAFLFIETLPLMPNGKIDRKALPRLDQTRPALDENFEAPRSHLEDSVAGIWCELLKVDRVGIHDDFFELGGHSLLGAKLISSLRRNLHVELNLIDIFQSPTIARLAALISQRQTELATEDDLASLLAEIENMSDEEAQQRFAEELAKGGSHAQALKLTLVSTGTTALEILSNTL
ncbi:MAG: amino acid adenylation domain-containing protein [Pyrinomonadaceae bacterium]|nr:amino acid adenylation domain-containing protein [Pyrinomonadaceae bacterium]